MVAAACCCDTELASTSACDGAASSPSVSEAEAENSLVLGKGVLLREAPRTCVEPERVKRRRPCDTRGWS